MPTLEQRRAAHAWAKAGGVIKKHKKEYVNAALGLPALIVNSGLLQVMAFLNQKGGAHNTLAADLRDWLHQQCGTPEDFGEFMEHLYQLQEAQQYQAISAETIAWLRWLRQMANARKGDN